MIDLNNDAIRNAVRDRYSLVAEEKSADCGCSCCGSPASATLEEASQVLGYGIKELQSLPEGANLGLGCGNPQAIASLKKGETVLDLGSGGGIDCFLAARSVGPEGSVIGVDMTPAMISRARASAVKGGFTNVDFRLGEIERLPVADGQVDVIVSNCVINLSPDKPQVFREAFRVLKRGGRLAISDMVASGPIPEELKQDMHLVSSCLTGAAPVQELVDMLKAIGFEAVRVQPKNESREFVKDWAPGSGLEDFILSATIEAVRP